jgi:putative transposase
MDTHIHILVATPEPNLGLGMKWLCGLYAQEFNSRYRRSGHLFGGRFYSDVIAHDDHLVASLVYILLNPVRAGMVESAADWPWSSYSATVGLVAPPSFLDLRGVLDLVDPDSDVAQRRLALAISETQHRVEGSREPSFDAPL